MWRAYVPPCDGRYAPPESRIPTYDGNVERRCADIARWISCLLLAGWRARLEAQSPSFPGGWGQT